MKTFLLPSNKLELRRQRTIDMIRTGREMDVELATEIYSPPRRWPKVSQGLRFWLSLHQLDFRFLTTLCRCRIKGYLASREFEFVPGFRCLYGNIVCDGAYLFDARFVDYADVYVGRGTGFSYQNMVITSAHAMEDMKTVLAREIVIGENVWITSRVTILGGVHIGRNSVIGAGSVVTRDIPPDVFAAGNPATPIKKVNRG
jgi:acetyltransferase-like isoleucine patch superfamily enzyme